MSAEKTVVRHVDALPYLKKFLAKPVRGAESLQLNVMEGETIVVLGEWQARDVRPALAVDLIEAVDAQVIAREEDVLATVRYVGKDGKELQRRSVKRHCEREEGVEPSKMSGSSMDQAAMAQRHLEKMSGQYIRGIDAMTQQVTRLAEATTGIVETLSARLAATEFEANQLRRQLARQPLAQGEGADDIDKEQQAQLMGLLMQFAPLLLPKPAVVAVKAAEAVATGNVAAAVAAVEAKP